jgi:hypothetical protein
MDIPGNRLQFQTVLSRKRGSFKHHASSQECKEKLRPPQEFDVLQGLVPKTFRPRAGNQAAPKPITPPEKTQEQDNWSIQVQMVLAYENHLKVL